MKPKNDDKDVKNTLQNNVENDKENKEENIPNENLSENKSNISMDDLSENEVFPEIKENAIEAVKAQKAEEKQEADKLELEGIKLKKDGTPAKKRGRKPHDEKSAFVMPQGVNQPIVSPSMEAGILTSALLEQLSVGLISDDFVLSEFERQSNIKAWVDCYDHYGGVKVTPPMALVMNHMAIVFTRAQKEKTQTKIALVRAWFKNKVANFKNKKGDKNAHTDSRANDVGENDLRKKES
jgi:hypothetical protein